MDYFKLKRVGTYYSKAYMYYRKEWIEAHLGIIVLIIVVAVAIPFIIKVIRKFIRELKSL